jgi:hypothetical protein
MLWYATGRRQHQLRTAALLIEQMIPGSGVISDLNIYVDAKLVMETHVQLCFDTLRQLCKIRLSVSAATFRTLLAAPHGSFQAGLR